MQEGRILVAMLALLFFPIFLCCTMRIYLNEELWGVLRKNYSLFALLLAAAAPGMHRWPVWRVCPQPGGRNLQSLGCSITDIPEPKGCVRCQQDAVLSAVPRVVVAFWGSEIHVFLCPDNAVRWFIPGKQRG